jgi:hypothetical protein
MSGEARSEANELVTQRDHEGKGKARASVSDRCSTRRLETLALASMYL